MQPQLLTLFPVSMRVPYKINRGHFNRSSYGKTGLEGQDLTEGGKKTQKTREQAVLTSYFKLTVMYSYTCTKEHICHKTKGLFTSLNNPSSWFSYCA